MNATVHGFLLVDKPRGMTSHDVVAWARRQLGTRRVGHAGTLDPAAEGLLIVAAGTATKLINIVQDAPKQYLAHVVLGIESDSADAEGTVQLEHSSTAVPTIADVQRALEAFTGTIQQTPPAFSAIKVGGQALYHKARRGESVEVPSRTVTIQRCEALDYHYPDLLMRVDCDKGVYIRSIARDLGAALNTGAYLHTLVRTRIGAWSLSQSWAIGEMEGRLRPETWTSYGMHPDMMLAGWSSLILDQAAVAAWYHGRSIPAERGSATTTSSVRVYDWSGEWLGGASFDEGRGLWQPRQVVARPDRRSV